MIRNKYDNIIDQFELYYPYLYEQAVDWWSTGRLYITVKLSDGTLVEFNPMDNTIRTIHKNYVQKDVEVLRKDIGHNIKKVVFGSSMSQNEIAQRCDITPAMLSRYIHGTSMPGIDKITILAEVLGCRVSDLVEFNVDED